MKFSCEKSILQDAIATASRAVTNKSPIALLEGLLMTAKEQLTLCGFDMSMGIRVSIDASIVTPGSIVLNARLLGDIIRKLPNDTIYFETDDKLLTTIKCGRAVFNLIASDASDFPQMPEVDKTSAFIHIPEKTLKSMISQTIFAVSDNESKPIHTGCLFETSGEKLNVAAVDGYRLSVRREILEEPCKSELRFVVPGSALREVERILGEADTNVAIYPDAKHILFEIGSTMLISRLIEGEFLNYQAAIPQNNEYEITIQSREMITCVERVSLIVSEKLKNPVRMAFSGDTLKMSCITAIGKSYDEIPYQGHVENLEIGFNNRYVLDALRACPEGDVKISLKGSLNPMVITPAEGNSFTYLVLPVRLKANE